MPALPHLRRILFVAACFLAAVPCGAQSRQRQGEGARPDDLLAMQRRWWVALSGSDTAYLARWSSPRLVVTLSSGTVHDRASLLRFAGNLAHPVSPRWSAEAVELSSAALVVMHAEAVEGDGPRSSHYRYLTVFAREDGRWRVVSAQSTRMPVFTPRLTGAQTLDAYAGSYRTPRGLALRIVATDTIVSMIEPSGLELRCWPIGPDLFESDYVAPDGAITRLAFSRDTTGRVAALNVLSPGMVSTFPRMK